jgi:hypothetical protein
MNNGTCSNIKNIDQNLGMRNSQQLTHLLTMQTGQAPTLMLELAVYTHCEELHKSKKAQEAGRPQPLLARSSMQYLQENLVTCQLIYSKVIQVHAVVDPLTGRLAIMIDRS